MKTMMLIAIAVLMTMTMAKSDETIGTKVKTFIVNEVNETKKFKKASWQKGKEQNAKNWEKLKSLFT